MSNPAPGQKPRPANPVNAAIRELEQVCQEHQTRRATLAAAVDDERAKREIAEAGLKQALAENETLKNELAVAKGLPVMDAKGEG